MRVLGVGLALAAVLGLPGAVEGQTYEARVAVAWHGATPCGDFSRNSGFALGIEVRNRGPWIASGAIDLIVGDLSYGCVDVGRPPVDYEGQLVDLRGDSGNGLLRSKVALGRTVDVGPVRSEITVGAGLLPTYTSYGAGGNDFSWEPWYGGALTVRVPGSSAGLQVEVGRHRLTQRYYEYEGDALIAEFHRWEPLVRLGMAFPF